MLGPAFCVDCGWSEANEALFDSYDEAFDPSSVAETVAREQKRIEDEVAHRMAMNVLGDPGDPLKAAIEKVIPGRVDVKGNLTKGPRSI